MAGLQHLFDLYKKQGKEFLGDIFNKPLVITEKPDGSILSFQKPSENKFDFYKRDDRQPISKLDRTIISLYEPPIDYISKKAEGMKIPSNLRFGFEYFQNTKPVSIGYDKLPKNGLVLTHMKELDKNNKVTKFIDDPKVLSKWAKKFNVEEPFVVFDGKLDKEQKVKLVDFLETPFEDLVEKFKTSSFTKYIISILNPTLKKTALNNTVDKPIEGLVFKFNDGEHLAKVVDPVFTQTAREKALDRHSTKKTSSDEFGLILYTFVNWLLESEYLDKISVTGNDNDERYIDIMTKLTLQFIKDNKTFLSGLDIKKPDFANAPEFKLNTRFIKNPDIVSFIKKHPDKEDIFRLLISGFKKIRKRKTPMIDDNLKNQINNVVSLILDKTNQNVNESFMSFNEWKKYKLNNI